MGISITFKESAKEFVLDAFDKAIDEEGYVVYKKNKKIRVLTSRGQELHISQFGGVKKGKEEGSIVFFEDDLDSAFVLND